MKKILVLNSGSSSLKYQLFQVNGDDYDVIAKGLAERIGIDGSFVSIKIGDSDKVTKNVALPSHVEAINEVFAMLLNGALSSLEELSAVGHRVVHGGEAFNKSTLLNNEAVATIEEMSALAPLHNPANVLGIKAITTLLPNIKQVAVFDTAFHQTMDKEAFLYALPIEQYTKHKIRRYGFHGTSHFYVSDKLAKISGKKGKFVTCHLGNGASLAAIKDGQCVDTSMGFTPLAGVVMGTRTGDIDPYVPLHIMKTQNKTVDEVNNMLNKQSGYFGLCGYGDMRDLEDAFMKGEEKAVGALNTYVHCIVRFIGSYIAVLNGVDSIVFTAGIGENSPVIRKLICDRLSFLGIKINDEANNQRGHDICITTPDSNVSVWVIPTNEELVIAQDTVKLV